MNLYRLAPRWMRRKLYAILAERQRFWRESEDGRMPKVKLTEKHISNLRPLLNRKSLLQHLPHNAVVAEIGVAAGDFSKQILEVCQPKELHLIDSWASERYSLSLKRKVQADFGSHINSGQVFIHEKDSIEAASHFADGHFDWIYLDTDHSYEQTALELLAYQRKIKPGGFITGHDFIIGNWISGVRYGVIPAVYEFCAAQNWELAFMTMDWDEFPSFGITSSADA